MWRCYSDSNLVSLLRRNSPTFKSFEDKMGNLKVSRGLQQSLVFGKGSKLNIEFRYLQNEQRSKVNAEFHHKVAACSVSSVD